jgi:hypothetical protein
MDKTYFLLDQHYGAAGKQSCAQESTFSPFHRCFTLLPSEGKSTIAKALNKQSVRLEDEYVIVTQVNGCFGRRRQLRIHDEARGSWITADDFRHVIASARATHRIERTRI